MNKTVKTTLLVLVSGLTLSTTALAAKRHITFGLRSAGISHDHWRRIPSTTSRKASDQIMRCIRISSVETPASIERVTR